MKDLGSKIIQSMKLIVQASPSKYQTFVGNTTFTYTNLPPSVKVIYKICR